MSASDVCRRRNLGICEYTKKHYNNYRFGNPSDAASKIIDDYDRLESLAQDMRSVFKDMNEHLDLAGSLLRPGMKVRVKRDIRTILNVQSMLNTL